MNPTNLDLGYKFFDPIHEFGERFVCLKQIKVLYEVDPIQISSKLYNKISANNHDYQARQVNRVGKEIIDLEV